MKQFLKTLLAAFLGTCAALLICTFLLFGLIGSIAALGSSETESTMPSEAILKISLSQPLPDMQGMEQFSLLSFDPSTLTTETKANLYNALRAIEHAANDPAIKFVYIDASGVGMSITTLEEVRRALLKVKDAGKGIIAYARSMSQGAYYIASVADKIYVHNMGSAEFAGLSANMLFFKNLIDKLGVDVQLIRHGKFKAAGEQFTKSGMTAENREQNEVMLNSIWESISSDICKSRDISKEQFNKLIDNLELTDTESLIKANLIDESVSEQEFSDILCTLASVEKEKDLKFITLSKYTSAITTNNYKIKDKVAIVYANGEIMMGGSLASAKELTGELKKADADSSVKAIVLRVNSPGGDAHAAEIIREQIQFVRNHKPIIVSFGDYAASGGYWISAQSEKIFTNNSTITGSIGVFSLIFTFGDAIDKQLHVKAESVSTHKHSDMFAGFRSLNSREIEYLQEMVEDVYTKFTDIVADGRNLKQNYVDEIGQGRVWSGAMAKEIKLADETGGITDAVEYAAIAAGLTDYRVVEYPKAKSSMDLLLESLGNSANAITSLTDPLAIVEKYYNEAMESNGTKCFARLPYLYNIK